MAAATAARSRSATEWASWAPRTEPCWGNSFPRTGCATALLPLRPCAAEVGERSGFPRHRGGGGGGEKARIPTQKKSRCVERILRLYASWQNLDRPKSGALKKFIDFIRMYSDVENRRSFSCADDVFDIGHADAFDLITVDEDRQFLLGQRCPVWTPLHHERSRPILADRERRRLERGVLKRSSSPERATDCHAQLIGLGCRRRKENGW
ncbi:hypothetical protein GWK47_045252 [Chionoecetes opilio]|uniref:Uncharacterized protein n=1 Tax=Chionoecetes opilio TaxID=41210 RepID=A0A8J4Y7F9_CHIOP|nr:hypothetical protein GWK47_045252 [Chionoecetes opilio]